jgi:hypothetical protein
MKSRNDKRNGPAAGILALAAALAMSPCSAAAEEGSAPSCDGLVGTYVTTITDREGVFASRGLMSFATGGVMIMSDSAQGGVPGVWDPFSSSQGAWRCLGSEDGKLQVGAVGLNFVLPRDGRRPAMGRVDYEAGLDTVSGTLSGKATLRLFDAMDLEATDPIASRGKLVDEFELEGTRVTVEP